MNEFEDYAKYHPGIKYYFSKQEYEMMAKGYYEIYKDFLPKDKNAKILALGIFYGFSKSWDIPTIEGLISPKRVFNFAKNM